LSCLPLKTAILISPKQVVQTLGFVVFVLLLANLVGQTAKYFFGYEHLFGFVERTYFQANLSIPGWYSSAAYLVCATLLLIISIAKQQARDRYVWHWRGLTILFALISMDKISSFHEMVYIPHRIPVALIVLFLYLRFFLHLPRKTKVLFVIGVCFYITAAFVIDFVGVEILEVPEKSFIFAMFQTGNQLFKMLGTLVFIYALLSYISDRIGDLHIQIKEANDVNTVPDNTQA
jgi:hypothetical protein